MRVHANGEGPLVLKLPGLAGGVELCRAEIDAAVAAGFRVATLDTTGDRADDPASAPLGWDSLAAEVDRAIDRVGGGPAVIWGTSFGSLIALAAARRYPERVAGLLLSLPPDPEWRPAPYVSIIRWANGREDPTRSVANVFRFGFTFLTGWEFANPTALVKLPGLRRKSLEASTPATTIREKLDLLWGEHPGRLHGARQKPTSIIAARLDSVAPLSRARRMAAWLPDARVRVIHLAGHAAAYSRPKLYQRCVIEELRRMT